MSLYHEAASVLEAEISAGGNLRSRVFGRKDLKSSPNQVYALALETCKWSSVLSEIIDQSQLLQVEKKVGRTCSTCESTALIMFPAHATALSSAGP